MGEPSLSSMPERAYGPTFWLAYVANALFVAATSMLVRYADFVTYLGGAEGKLGLIVGTGMVGSLTMRLLQGSGIDHYGPRRVWMFSLQLFVISALAHLWIDSVSGPSVFLARTLMQTSIAGVFGASITSISRRVPPERVPEIIGMLGSSGFLGLLVGPQLADFICREQPIGRMQLDRLFICMAGLSLLALIAAWRATYGQTQAPTSRRPRSWAVLLRYRPAAMMLVAVVCGAGMIIPHTFLRLYLAPLQIHSVGTFFVAYAISAFFTRILCRSLFQRYGADRLVALGMLGMSMGFMAYLGLQSAWQLVIPGSLAGAAQAVLFPALVGRGSVAFPERYRGLGTTAMLAMFDIGGLVGAPLAGGVVHVAPRAGLAPYPTMFLLLAGSLMSVAIWYYHRTRQMRTTFPS